MENTRQILQFERLEYQPTKVREQKRDDNCDHHRRDPRRVLAAKQKRVTTFMANLGVVIDLFLARRTHTRSPAKALKIVGVWFFVKV